MFCCSGIFRTNLKTHVAAVLTTRSFRKLISVENIPELPWGVCPCRKGSPDEPCKKWEAEAALMIDSCWKTDKRRGRMLLVIRMASMWRNLEKKKKRCNMCECVYLCVITRALSTLLPSVTSCCFATSSHFWHTCSKYLSPGLRPVENTSGGAWNAAQGRKVTKQTNKQK